MTEGLIQAAAMLAIAAPEQWGRFCAELAKFQAEATRNLVSSDLGSLQVNQGRAQAYSLILKTLDEAVQKQREVEARKQDG